MAQTDSGGKIRITVSMYRKNIDGGYKRMIEEKVANGVFDEYIVALLHTILQEGTADNSF